MAKLHEGVVGITASIAAGGTVNVQPPVGQQWLINSIGLGPFSTADALMTSGEVYLTNGSNPVLLRKGVAGGSAATQRQWSKPMRFGLTNSLYLQLKNVNGTEAARFCYSGAVTGIGTTGVGDIHSAISTGVTAGSTINVQPPAGEAWALLEIGITAAQWANAGGADGWYPQLMVSAYNGTNSVPVLYTNVVNVFTPLRMVFDNTTYLQIQNQSGVTTDIGYIAQRVY